MPDPAALTAQQHRAADLLGRNWSVEQVAAEVGVSGKTIQRWKHREGFMAVVKERRDALLAEVPGARATLEAALNATTAKGEPDWPIRVKAAQLLMTAADPAGPPPPEEDRPTFIYVPPEEDGDHAPDAG